MEPVTIGVTATIIILVISAMGGGKGFSSLLYALLAIGAFIWAVTTLGSQMAIIVGIALVVMWLLFKK